jgi:16S rRNA (guanine966-N2)-methyltransferase
LKGPTGPGTRPMTDRLKVSLFDTLVPYGIEGARVLDLYAGSGSLGIEMLSRGAEWADFVEQNPSMCRLISDNLRTTGLAERAHVYKMWVARFLTMKRHQAEGTPHGGIEDESGIPTPKDSGAEYDIILLDPPYADPAIEDTMETVALAPYLSGDGLVVIGHATRVKLAEQYGGGRIARARHREMGGSAFSIYERV